MSSVLRFLKQTPSNTFFNEAGADVWTYAQIQTAVNANSGVYVAASVIEFPSQTDLTTALGAIIGAVSTDTQTALKDMGKRLYMGVAGAESEMVVFGLVQVIQGSGADAGTIGYVCLQDMTGTLDVAVGRGAF